MREALTLMRLTISFRGTAYEVAVPENASLHELGVLLEQVTGAAASTQKLLFAERPATGRSTAALRPDDKTLRSVLECGELFTS
jgi:hypothetical protein